MDMNREDYEHQIEVLTDQVELMRKLRCPLMAKKYERMIADLKKRYPEYNKGGE